MSTKQPESTHLPHVPALDGVRAVSILAVVLGHTFPVGPDWLNGNVVAARTGMALFFCLSGFLIVSMIQRSPDMFSFLVKRILRIVPAVALYLVILTILFQIPWDMFLANILFVSNYWNVGLNKGIAPTSHLWSLCVEMHFYLAIAALTLLMGRKSLWLIPPAALIVTGLRIEAGAYAVIMTHLRVDEILSGGILALVAFHYGAPIRRFLTPTWRPALLLLVITPIWLYAAYNGPLAYARPYLTAIVVGIVIHSRLMGLHMVLESRIAAYIAKISYALYIYHPLAVFGWFNQGSLTERYLFKRPISYLLSWIAAHLSTFFWEMPWQKAARTIVKRQQASKT